MIYENMTETIGATPLAGCALRDGGGEERQCTRHALHEGLLERAGWLLSPMPAGDRCAEPSPQGEGSRRQAAGASAGDGDRAVP